MNLMNMDCIEERAVLLAEAAAAIWDLVAIRQRELMD
jgi:hypothetical protein